MGTAEPAKRRLTHAVTSCPRASTERHSLRVVGGAVCFHDRTFRHGSRFSKPTCELRTKQDANGGAVTQPTPPKPPSLGPSPRVGAVASCPGIRPPSGTSPLKPGFLLMPGYSS